MPSDRMDEAAQLVSDAWAGKKRALERIAGGLSAAATARPDPHPLIAWIRGMCSDEEPYELIDAKLAELDELLGESQ
jgi:hypothetical protein